ncbi:MAG: glycosyl transferase family 2 [Rhodospirillaceae bacterium]|nr:glycosyl transferase family 2 [Rhodospirillaceae bacterium]
MSVVIPALNAEARLPACLAALEEAEGIERVVVDGRSSDGTAAAAVQGGARVLEAERGRGNQLAAGAEAAEGEWLLFLHADTVLSPDWWQAVRMFMAAEGNAGRAAVFRFALDDPAPAARRLERIVRWRTRVLGLPYGDQGLLISRALYRAVGGYRRIPIMEDVALVRRIGRRRLVMLDIAAVTSAARYRRGYLRRSARNLVCLSLYFAGVPPRTLKRLYG